MTSEQYPSYPPQPPAGPPPGWQAPTKRRRRWVTPVAIVSTAVLLLGAGATALVLSAKTASEHGPDQAVNAFADALHTGELSSLGDTCLSKIARKSTVLDDKAYAQAVDGSVKYSVGEETVKTENRSEYKITAKYGGSTKRWNVTVKRSSAGEWCVTEGGLPTGVIPAYPRVATLTWDSLFDYAETTQATVAGASVGTLPPKVVSPDQVFNREPLNGGEQVVEASTGADGTSSSANRLAFTATDFALAPTQKDDEDDADEDTSRKVTSGEDAIVTDPILLLPGTFGGTVVTSDGRAHELSELSVTPRDFDRSAARSSGDVEIEDYFGDWYDDAYELGYNEEALEAGALSFVVNEDTEKILTSDELDELTARADTLPLDCGFAAPGIPLTGETAATPSEHIAECVDLSMPLSSLLAMQGEPTGPAAPAVTAALVETGSWKVFMAEDGCVYLVTVRPFVFEETTAAVGEKPAATERVKRGYAVRVFGDEKQKLQLGRIVPITLKSSDYDDKFYAIDACDMPEDLLQLQYRDLKDDVLDAVDDHCAASNEWEYPSELNEDDVFEDFMYEYYDGSAVPNS
ncbi:hypothetical protein [Lysinibacter cavernae]|uniref:DUF4878 domain-containing protein n=1 Tax=Lysinibacter cavernae TaxID=1640652 RepID=A0A7X5TT58_9MICO|nr:hypothetical protein [Lysinibacter cavernae]NIH53169.1 hypothetical protein [Lysinibacter cavernae]